MNRLNKMCDHEVMWRVVYVSKWHSLPPDHYYVYDKLRDVIRYNAKSSIYYNKLERERTRQIIEMICNEFINRNPSITDLGKPPEVKWEGEIKWAGD